MPQYALKQNNEFVKIGDFWDLSNGLTDFNGIVIANNPADFDDSELMELAGIDIDDDGNTNLEIVEIEEVRVIGPLVISE